MIRYSILSQNFPFNPTIKQDAFFQKIGQLFMIAAWSDPEHKDYDANGVQSLIDNYGDRVPSGASIPGGGAVLPQHFGWGGRYHHNM